MQTSNFDNVPSGLSPRLFKLSIHIGLRNPEPVVAPEKQAPPFLSSEASNHYLPVVRSRSQRTS